MVKYRLTGINVGPLGAQWEKRDDDREISRRVLNLWPTGDCCGRTSRGRSRSTAFGPPTRSAKNWAST